MNHDPAGQWSTDTYTDEPSRDLWMTVEAMERLLNKHATNVAGCRPRRCSKDV